MPATIHLADGTTINREDALASQKNVVARNAQFNSLIALSMGVWKHRPAVATLVAMHIGVGPECVEMAHPKTWKRGGFNLIVPMLVKDNSSQGTSAVQVGDQVILRIPTPAKVGEKQHPGSVADKLRCNILIDDDWHVTALFDLEWLFAAPVDKLRTPSWLTWQSVDGIALDGYDDYCATRNVFMNVFREEERNQTGTGETPLSDAMDASWTSQRTWFYVALANADAMTQIFEGRLKPLFWPADTKAETKTKPKTNADGADGADGADNAGTSYVPPKRTAEMPYEALCQLWQPDAQAVVAQKVRDRDRHKTAIEKLFADEKVALEEPKRKES